MNYAGACIFVGLAILALLAFGVPAKVGRPTLVSPAAPSVRLSTATVVKVESRGGAFLAQTTPRYYDEQVLNYRFTEFCASVKKPPPGLIESIDNAFEKDKSVGPIWLWVHDIAEKVRVRCGDA